MLGEHSSIILLFKSTIFLLSEIRIASLFSLTISRVIVSSLILASESYYVLGQLKLFLIMLSLESIYRIFSLQSASSYQSYKY